MGRPTGLNADNTVFVLLSFEGPDRYSQAGGLGVRVTNLSQTLATMGFPTHLFFIGDPRGKGEETGAGMRLVLHRWCQWISEYYPAGVYQGENEKLYDFNESLPGFINDRIIKPALDEGKLVVILGEEWHTTEVMSRIANMLEIDGTRERVVMFWNANNTFGFDRIDWKRLAVASIITTVSRYMKQIMRGVGVNPMVIPNGIPSALLNQKVDARAAAEFKEKLRATVVLAKVARWDPDKCWNAAVEAAARLKERGLNTVLLARGGIEPHGEEVKYNARQMGLKVVEITDNGGNGPISSLKAIASGETADILDIKFHCTPDLLQIIYRAASAVLANSGHEPFGLVGLEAMAAGGVAFTGGTGEDYAIPFHNSIVLETSDPREIEAYVAYLHDAPQESERIREAAKQTASQFTWEHAARILIRKLEYQARNQGLLADKNESSVQEGNSHSD
ncbi:MAG: glycosyltransferase [Chloroflexi bacterium]|nr:glycosyltransferase [Chloroflexota bacterium]